VRIPSLRAAVLLLAVACSGGGDEPAGETLLRGDSVQPPVALDPVPAVAFPEGLIDTASAATVRLRLFVDEQGHVVADSTRVAESSGVAALDSAAVEGAPRIRYAPALKEGEPVAAAFVQPVEFRRP
jgi:TonB family protein